MSPTDAPPPDAASAQRIPVLQEDLQVLRDSTVTGAVRVRVQPQTQLHTLPLDSTHSHVEVERVAIDREVDSAVPPWRDGDVWVVPVYEERLVLQRRLVLKEEVRLHTRTSRHSEQHEIPLRRDEVHVERLGADGQWAPAPMEGAPGPTADVEHTTPGGPAAATRDP